MLSNISINLVHFAGELHFVSMGYANIVLFLLALVVHLFNCKGKDETVDNIMSISLYVKECEALQVIK